MNITFFNIVLNSEVFPELGISEADWENDVCTYMLYLQKVLVR